jgi:hypothetical protein
MNAAARYGLKTYVGIRIFIGGTAWTRLAVFRETHSERSQAVVELPIGAMMAMQCGRARGRRRLGRPR